MLIEPVYHKRGVASGRDNYDRYERALAAFRAVGDRYWQRVLTRYVEVGAHEDADVRANLATL
jgi:hypothetical protein